MAKLTVSSISSTNDTTPAVNKAIQKLVSELNDKVLYRNNPLGEPNSMSNDLDMGDNDILNAGLIACQTLLVAGSTEVGDSGEAILDLVATINQLETDVTALQLSDTNLETRVDGLEADHLNFDGRLTTAESTLVTQNATLTTLAADLDLVEADVAELLLPKVLSTVNPSNVPLSTTPTVISGNTDLITCACIERLVDGSIRYNKAGNFIVTFTFKIVTTSNIEVYFWVEKWNGTTWDVVPYSGIIRDLPSLRETEISASYIRETTVAGEIYRVMGSAASDNGAILSADVLPSGAIMPSIRIDIRGK